MDNHIREDGYMDENAPARDSWERTLERIEYFSLHGFGDESLGIAHLVYEETIVRELMARVIGSRLPTTMNEITPNGPITVDDPDAEDDTVTSAYIMGLKKLKERCNYPQTSMVVQGAITWVRRTYKIDD